MPRTLSSSSAAQSSTDETDLPDGSCISPRRLVKSLDLHDSTNATVDALYAGSFPVVGENQDECMECVRRMLLEMKSVGKTRPVLLAISLSGIKVCSHTGESILMAHALRRISYTTCHPEFCQFSFLAREPKADTSFQHCHVFITRNPQEAEELNAVVARAFSVAYALQRQSQVVDRPTFNELIGRQLDAQRKEEEEGLQGEFTRQQQQRQQVLTQHLGDISTSLVGRRLEERHRMRQQSTRDDQQQRQRERTVWAKHAIDRVSCDCLLPDNERQGSPLPVTSSSFQETVFQQLKSEDISEGLCHHPEASGPILSSDILDSGALRTIQGTADDDGPSEGDYLCPASCGLEIPRMDATGSQLEFQICHHMATEEECLSDEGNSGDAGNGPQQCTTDRPLSGKYQNDARGDSGGLDSEGRDIYQGPPTPIRHDSLRKMTTLQGMPFDDPQEAAWFQPRLPREKTLELLTQQDIGSFVIRDSTTHPGCFALSVKVPRYDNPTGISHYLITRTAKGCFKMKGLEKEWQTLDSLVTHHTVMRELLPCLLHLPRSFNSLLSRDLDKDGGNY